MPCRVKYMWKFSYMEVIRGKWNKVKTGLFTSWRGYNNKWRKQDANNCFLNTVKPDSYIKE